MANTEITLQVVINGLPTSLTFQSQQPLQAVIAEALGKTGNSGRADPKDWNATNAAGDALDPRRTLAQLGLASGGSLFLSLGAGVGGC
jgi:hypothetical protein